VLAFRLVRPEYALGLDGEGARLAGGRWNSPGTALIYCASSPALAALESWVHLPITMRVRDGLPLLVLVSVFVPDEMEVLLPQVIFLEDRSLERGDKMLILLNQLSADRKPGMLDDEELADGNENDDDLEADED